MPAPPAPGAPNTVRCGTKAGNASKLIFSAGRPPSDTITAEKQRLAMRQHGGALA